MLKSMYTAMALHCPYHYVVACSVWAKHYTVTFKYVVVNITPKSINLSMVQNMWQHTFSRVILSLKRNIENTNTHTQEDWYMEVFAGILAIGRTGGRGGGRGRKIEEEGEEEIEEEGEEEIEEEGEEERERKKEEEGKEERERGRGRGRERGGGRKIKRGGGREEEGENMREQRK